VTDSRARTLELVAFVAILAVGAALRFVDLPTRGTWDADQGHDMLVLRDFVERGAIPLLGPPTSIGDFHHGMLYYLLLAPAAAVSDADPTVVTAWIALGGVLAIGVTGWLGRSIGGPVAGLTAAFLMAVSASAVEESTFIWNPNVIALTSSIALAAAWHAWHARRAGWWVAAGAAAVATMHCHVLGVILTPVVAALLIADVQRRRRAGDLAGAGSVGRSAAVWIVLLVLSYVPLAIHEATSDASELRAALAFLAGGGGPASIALPARFPIVGLRVLGWPLAGLITDAPIETILAAALVIVLSIWRGWLVPASSERTAVRWLTLGLLWTVAALSIGASSLATVVIGLPNDHYHAFADPIVFVLVGVGVAALIRPVVNRDRPVLRADSPIAVVSGLVGLAVVMGLAGWNLLRQPATVVADGGWPAAQLAAARVALATDDRSIALDSLPAVKPADALRFPLERLAGGRVVAGGPEFGQPAPNTDVVILCDQLFHEAIGAACDGPAESARLAALLGPAGAAATLVDQFEVAPGRWISVYRPTPPG
jgi:Dolichyl-phosphate-mannose-protein mannosyltransferase